MSGLGGSSIRGLGSENAYEFGRSMPSHGRAPHAIPITVKHKHRTSKQRRGFISRPNRMKASCGLVRPQFGCLSSASIGICNLPPQYAFRLEPCLGATVLTWKAVDISAVLTNGRGGPRGSCSWIDALSLGGHDSRLPEKISPQTLRRFQSDLQGYALWKTTIGLTRAGIW